MVLHVYVWMFEHELLVFLPVWSLLCQRQWVSSTEWSYVVYVWICDQYNSNLFLS